MFNYSLIQLPKKAKCNNLVFPAKFFCSLAHMNLSANELTYQDRPNPSAFQVAALI